LALRNPSLREGREEKAELWKIMSSKIIVIATIILLLVSFSVLFVVETKNHDLDYKKSWSVAYFENPRDLPEAAASLQAGDSLDFAIENHEGEKMKYSYEILADGKKIAEGQVEIEAGETRQVAPLFDLERKNDARVSLEISAKDLKYRIYKNLK